MDRFAFPRHHEFLIFNPYGEIFIMKQNRPEIMSEIERDFMMIDQMYDALIQKIKHFDAHSPKQNKPRTNIQRWFDWLFRSKPLTFF